MKKILSLMVLAAALVACTQDDPAAIDAPETAAVITPSAVNTTLIQPRVITPRAAFDQTQEGVYHGIFVTNDASIHGKIWVNVGNDDQYDATIISDIGEHFNFKGFQSATNTNFYKFENGADSFVFDLTNFNRPKATDVVVNNIEGHIVTVKDRSDQRAASALGTYVDLNDDTFAGTWDLMTDGSIAGNPFAAPNLTMACILGPGGAMFIDDVFETFDYPCITGAMGTTPVFITPADGFGDLNEFWAQDQTLDINGNDLTYWLGQSSLLSQNNNTEDSGYHNNDFAAMPATGCFIFNGFKSVWFFNGRVGSASFDDPFDGTAMTRNNPDADVAGLYEAVSNVVAQPIENPFE